MGESAVSGEKRVVVVTEVVLCKPSLFSRSRRGYDMIVTDRRFIFANRAIAEEGFAAGGEMVASQYSLSQDPDVIAAKEKTIQIPFTQVRRIRMETDIFGCIVNIDYADAQGRKTLGVSIPPGLRTLDNVFVKDKDRLLRQIHDTYGDVPVTDERVLIAVNNAYFVSIAEKLKGALPTSVVLESEWPLNR
jgi:hypothetical protein